MTDIPDYLKQNFNASILGRTKLKLYELISNRKDWLPDEPEIGRFILQHFRSNPEIGKLFLFFLTRNSLKSTPFSELQAPKDITQLLSELEEEPLEKAFILEVTECPDPMPTVLGACIYCETLRDGGYVYTTTLFDDKEFPKAFVGRLEIRASKDHPQPIFSVLVGSKFEHYDLSNYTNSPLAPFTLKILGYVAKNRHRSLVPVREAMNLELKEDYIHRPPQDKTFLALTGQVMEGKIKCTQTSLPLSMIQPYDFDFCITYPKETIKWNIREIRKGSDRPLLVYWNGSSFIMSDDYPGYLAHRSLNSKEVSVVILGDYPENLVTQPTLVGGAELLPPVLIRQGSNYDSLTPELKTWLLDERLRSKERSQVVIELYLLFIRLSMMLAEPATQEKQLHNFLINHPASLDPYGSCMMSEVRLGNEYRVDLVLQYKLDEKRILLVELEKANLPIFTKTGRLRAHVTHAIQQVEDWLQWWREHPNDIPKALDSSIPPQGLVVIGRNIDLDDKGKRRLVHLNNNRLVKVITYDDLLNRIEALIQSLESLDKDALSL